MMLQRRHNMIQAQLFFQMSLLYFSVDLNLKTETGRAFTSRTNPETQDEIQSSEITFSANGRQKQYIQYGHDVCLLAY